MDEQRREAGQRRRDVCLRLAYEVPVACVVGTIVAAYVGGYVRASMGPATPLPSPNAYTVNEFMPWAVLAVCAGLLIYARPYWGHYVLFALYFLLVSIIWPANYH